MRVHLSLKFTKKKEIYRALITEENLKDLIGYDEAYIIVLETRNSPSGTSYKEIIQNRGNLGVNSAKTSDKLEKYGFQQKIKTHIT